MKVFNAVLCNSQGPNNTKSGVLRGTCENRIYLAYRSIVQCYITRLDNAIACIAHG